MTSQCDTREELGWLPRRVGFRFIGIMSDGTTIPCVMKKHAGPFPMFYVANETTGEACWNALIAWRRHEVVDIATNKD